MHHCLSRYQAFSIQPFSTAILWLYIARCVVHNRNITVFGIQILTFSQALSKDDEFCCFKIKKYTHLAFQNSHIRRIHNNSHVKGGHFGGAAASTQNWRKKDYRRNVTKTFPDFHYPLIFVIQFSCKHNYALSDSPPRIFFENVKP